MTTVSTNVQINIDSAQMAPAEAAAYVAAVMAELTTTLAAPALSAAVGTPAHIVGIDKQLGRLTDFNPAFAERVKKLHYELAAHGYVPTLPKSKKGTPPSYISYIDPVSGVNLGNLNSQTFTVMRGNLRDQLVEQPLFEANPRYAFCELKSAEAVDAVVELAAAQKQ